MKKAKEYAKEFVGGVPYKNEQEINNKIFKILTAFLDEVQTIAKMRHTKSNSTFLSIIKEQHRKWISFARHVNKMTGIQIIREDGFKDYVEFKLPEVKGKI
jgi:hypothetical protein